MDEKTLQQLQIIWPYVRAVIILIVGLIIIRIITRSKLLEKTKLQPTAQQFLQNSIKVLIWIIIALSIASSLGIDSASILALFAAAGAAIALAFQDTLSNLIGGFILMASNILQLGDYVIVGDKEGFVIKTSLLHTTLRTIDNMTIYLPNATLNKVDVVNATAAKARRLEVEVGISYDSDLELARKTLIDMAYSTPGVLNAPETSCVVLNYGDSGIILRLRTWIRSETYWDMIYEIKNRIKPALDEVGITIPFNQVDIHFDKEYLDKQ